ncbi:MAG: NUDIX domain-containing protein [Alphaproteobacteria bacterium]
MPGPVLRFLQQMRASARSIAAPVSLGARAIALNSQGQVLLVRHTYVGGWHLPGGGVDRGETSAEALLRELREEVGLVNAAPPELFGLYLRRDGRWSDHISLYVLRDIELAFHPNHEVAEIRFSAPDTLPHGTSGGTVRRLAEFSGRAPRETLW